MNQIIAVMVVLAGVLAISDAPEKFQAIAVSATESGQFIGTAGDIKSFAVLLDVNRIKKGVYPTDFENWVATNFHNNNLKPNVVDHWGVGYRYTVTNNGKDFKLVSAGPDKKFGSEDDLWASSY